jgi:SAM-dependent methyltransferase
VRRAKNPCAELVAAEDRRVDLTERLRTPERRHPWEAARVRFFKDVLARSTPLSAPIRVLDVASGDGWLAGQLAAVLHPDSDMTCWDSAYTDGLMETLATHEKGVRRFVEERPAGTFDLLLLLDVLEHVEDDARFLRELGSSLAAGGHALLSIPAWQRLFGRLDSRLKHFRRYLPEGARAPSMRRAGGPGVGRPVSLADGGALPAGARSAPAPPHVAPSRRRVARWAGADGCRPSRVRGRYPGL